MWVDRKTYELVQLRAAQDRASAEAMQQRVIAQETTIDWMRIRLTQLEHERAMLISNYMGVQITAPVFEKAPVKSASDFNHPLQSTPSFDDIGDEEAARLGITWDADGTIKHK